MPTERLIRSNPFSVVLVAGLILFGAISTAAGHDFWIAPRSGAVAPQEPIIGDLMVGIMLHGSPYPYIPDYIVRFDVTAMGETDPVKGLPGDIPALDYMPRHTGLQIIAHQTVPFRITYDDWELFRKYVVEEGFPEAETVHLKRGLPPTGFSERYTRYAKALVQVGPLEPSDRDARIGLPFELVAEANPYQPDLEFLPVRLFWHDQAAPDVQISIYRDNGSVERQNVRTNAEGRARIPLKPGKYLLNAVRIDAVENEPVAWFSHWASLSFILSK